MLSILLLYIHSWLYTQSMKSNDEKPSFWTVLDGFLWDAHLKKKSNLVLGYDWVCLVNM